MRTTALLLPLLLLALAPSVHAGHGDDLVQASLVADTTTIQPGQTFRIGVLLHIDPGWHIYWTNPGDSGLPTRVKLNLPVGFVAGDAQYPMPMRINLPGDIINYAYENQVMLIVPITAPKDLVAGTSLPISAKVSWLVCKDICLPGKADLNIMLRGGNAAAADAELFKKWSDLVPASTQPSAIQSLPMIHEIALSSGPVPQTHVEFTIQWNLAPESVQCFPDVLEGAQISNATATTQGDKTNVAFDMTGTPASAKMPLVIEYKLSGGEQQAWNCSIPLSLPHH